MGEGTVKHPEKLYRFRSDQTGYFFEDLDHAIFESEIFLAPFSALNDPFEALPRFDQGKPRQVLDYIKKFESRFGRDTLITGTNILAEAAARGLSQKQAKRVLRKWQKTPAAYAKFLAQTTWSSFINTRKAINIACFSEKWHSLLMWSHYCRGHRGICIEFQPLSGTKGGSAIGPVKMKYQSERPVISAVEALEYLASTMLGDRAPDFFDPRSSMETLEKSMLTKSSEWSYEQEWRYLAVDEPGGYKKLHNLRASAILVGANICKARKSEILDRYRGRVNIFETYLKEDQYGLALREI